jgi:aerobic-type carbon monoxide dehydrogenase small subunit (CoxS/CutS family)
MLMSATALLEENPSPTEDEVKVALQGNICRCTGYWNIVDAVVAVGKGGAA